ncbi:hypothetical protein SDC9_189857 [bioreactor metagenome]|uniref:Uncharacterized protein n=1 Tax=bioreactor metagenome TaxID=1076179 RepID=A0A645HTW3_9ZZZZ
MAVWLTLGTSLPGVGPGDLAHAGVVRRDPDLRQTEFGQRVAVAFELVAHRIAAQIGDPAAALTIKMPDRVAHPLAAVDINAVQIGNGRV